MISHLLKSPTGTIQKIPDSNSYTYPSARTVTRVDEYDTWDVFFMYSDSLITPEPGDGILGAWDRDDNNSTVVTPDPELFTDVVPMGNTFNPGNGTYDGTDDGVPAYTNGAGAPDRSWGTVNEAPDDNQVRHIIATRFITEFGGQDYHRVRFTLQPPFDKDNPPNALAIFIYTAPGRVWPTDYFYTPGAFQWDAQAQEWYANTGLGQSPTSGPEEVYYSVGLGSLPLNGGGTVPFGEGHESYNWEDNI